ncbi:hypothetical protein BLA29_012918, partial [Euroglyphus maynei]
MATSKRSLTNHIEDATRTLWDEPLAPIPDKISRTELHVTDDEIDDVVELVDQKNIIIKKDANNNNHNHHINHGRHESIVDIQHHERLHDSRKIAGGQILSINSGPMSEGLLKVATPSSLQDTAKTICYFMSCLFVIGFLFIIT